MSYMNIVVNSSGPTGPTGPSSSSSAITAGIYGLAGTTGPTFQGYSSYGYVDLGYLNGYSTSTTDLEYDVGKVTIKTSGIYRIDVSIRYRLMQGPTGLYFGPTVTLGLTGTHASDIQYYPTSYSNIDELHVFSFLVPINMAIYGSSLDIEARLSATGDQGVPYANGVSPILNFDSDSTTNYMTVTKVSDLV